MHRRFTETVAYGRSWPADLHAAENSRDGIYRNGGTQLTVPIVEDGEGLAGTFYLGVQLT